MLGEICEILGWRAGLDDTLPRLRIRAGSFFVIAPELIGSSGEVCRDVRMLLEGFSEGVNDDVLLGACIVGVGISSPFSDPFILAFDASATSTSRFKYSAVSMDIGGVSSECTFVGGSRMRVAGVIGALNDFCMPDPSSIALEVRRGGGAIKTSGRGSGETDSFEELPRLIGCCIGVFCREVAGVDEFLLALRGVPRGGGHGVCACCAKALASNGAAASGGGGRFLCGFMLGDSRTTLAGVRELTDLRRPPLPLLPLLFFPIIGDCPGSTCAGIWLPLCNICGLGMWVRCWWASSAGDVNGLNAPGMTKSGIWRENSVSRGVTAGDTRGVKVNCWGDLVVQRVTKRQVDLRGPLCTC